MKGKVFFETFGCTCNQADTRIMKDLVKDDFEIVNEPGKGDVVVLNSCGVIERTERKILKKALQYRNNGKKVVLTGCLTKIASEVLTEKGINTLLTPGEIAYINKAIEKTLYGIEFIQEHKHCDKALLTPPSKEVIAPVPIAEGCLGHCTYCATRFARGRLKSYEPSSIIKAVQKNVEAGTKEIQLTAQDTGVYGKDMNNDLAGLLSRLARLEGDFTLRVGMMNPAHIRGFLHELIKAFKHPKIYRFLHIPLQSGDDRILRDMKRGYNLEDYYLILDSFRTAMPDLTLSTDIIVGYPTEDEDSFQKTVQAIKKISPDILNITRYSPRPMTWSARLKDRPDRIKKERSRILTELAKAISLEKNKAYLGTSQRVLVTEIGKDHTYLARTPTYKQVVLESGQLGEYQDVEITEARPYYLIGS